MFGCAVERMNSVNKPTIGKRGDTVKKDLYADLNNLLKNDKDCDTRAQKAKETTDIAYNKLKR